MTLQRRITLFMTLLVLGLLVSICTIVNLTIQRSERARLERDLEAARELAREVGAERFRSLEAGTRILADLPQVKAVVTSGNDELIADALQGFREMSHADLLGVVDRRGAFHGIDSRGLESLAPNARGYVRNGTRGLLQAVAVPVTVAGQEIATLIAAYRFEPEQLERLARMSRSEFGVLGAQDLLLATPRLAEVRGHEHIESALPLQGPDGTEIARLVAARPLDEGLLTAARLRTNVIAVSLVFGFLALCASFVFARSITRPLAGLAEALREADPAEPELLEELGALPELVGADQDMLSVLSSFQELVAALAAEREQAHGAIASRLQALEREAEALRRTNDKLAAANSRLASLMRDAA